MERMGILGEATKTAFQKLKSEKKEKGSRLRPLQSWAEGLLVASAPTLQGQRPQREGLTVAQGPGGAGGGELLSQDGGLNRGRE